MLMLACECVGRAQAKKFKNEAQRAVKIIRDAGTAGETFPTWASATNYLADGAKFKNPLTDLPYSDRGTLRRYLKEGGWTPAKRSGRAT